MVDNRTPDAGANLDRLSLSRRELLMGAGGVLLAGGLAACGGSGSSSSGGGGGGSSAPAGTPKKGGNFRLGVTGGGASDIIDGQSIVTKPDQTRLIGSWETLLTYDEDYVLGTDGLAEEVDSSVAGPVDDPAPLRHRVQQRQDAHRRRRHLLDPADPQSEGGPVRRRRPGLGRPEGHQEDGREHRPARPEAARLDDPATSSASTSTASCPSGTSARATSSMSAPARTRSRASRPASRVSRCATRTTGGRVRRPVVRPGDVTDFADSTAQVNALLAGQIDAITDIPFAQIDTAKAQGIADPRGERRRLAAAVHGHRHGSVHRRPRPPGLPPDGRSPGHARAGALRLRPRCERPLLAVRRVLRSSDLAQREQDIDQAKSLLKSAGKDGMTVDLHTTNGAAGMVDSANVFAAQARPPASRST